MLFPAVLMGSSDATRKLGEGPGHDAPPRPPLRPVDVSVAHLEVSSPPHKLENWCQVGQTRPTQLGAGQRLRYLACLHIDSQGQKRWDKTEYSKKEYLSGRHSLSCFCSFTCYKLKSQALFLFGI